MRILVVEDEPSIAAQLSEALTAAGYAVDVADNGVDAHWQAVDEGQPLMQLFSIWACRRWMGSPF